VGVRQNFYKLKITLATGSCNEDGFGKM